MRITVLGQHQIWLNKPGIDLIVAHEIRRFRQTMGDLRTRRLTDATDTEIDKRSKELQDELLQALQGVTVFEIEVQENSSLFEAHAFWDKHSDCQSLEQIYLNLAGTEVISDESNLPAEFTNFRVVIGMQDWPAQGELIGPTGSLLVPPVTPISERLCRFVPCSLVD